MARFADVDEMSAAFIELEAIVRDLAAGDPVANTGGQEWDDYVCMLCPDDEVYGAHEQVVHHKDCPYGQAKLWVSAHPVSGDQPSGEMCETCGGEGIVGSDDHDVDDELCPDCGGSGVRRPVSGDQQ